MALVDFHLHSFFSDGEVSPQEIYRMARAKTLSFFSLTEHNIVTSTNKDVEESDGPRFIQGIEISSFDYKTNQGWHILGYAKQFNTQQINLALMETVRGYDFRARRLIEKLNREYPGIDLDFDALKASSKEVYISRNTLAMALKQFLNTPTAFREITKLVFVEESSDWMLSPEQAVALIDACGGVAVLAHPGKGLSKNPSVTEALIQRLCVAGLSGIEARYSSHTDKETAGLISLAKKYNLFITAGSDWHGPNYTPKKIIGMELLDQELEVFLAAVL